MGKMERATGKWADAKKVDAKKEKTDASASLMARETGDILVTTPYRRTVSLPTILLIFFSYNSIITNKPNPYSKTESKTQIRIQSPHTSNYKNFQQLLQLRLKPLISRSNDSINTPTTRTLVT